LSAELGAGAQLSVAREANTAQGELRSGGVADPGGHLEHSAAAPPLPPPRRAAAPPHHYALSKNMPGNVGMALTSYGTGSRTGTRLR